MEPQQQQQHADPVENHPHPSNQPDDYFHPNTEGLMPPPEKIPPPQNSRKPFKINFPNISAPNVARTLSLRKTPNHNPQKGSLRSLPSNGDHGDLKKLRGQSVPVLPRDKKLDTNSQSSGRKSRSSSFRQNCVIS